MMNPDYFHSSASFKYLGGLADGMDIRTGTRPQSPVLFHHIDSKSFLALQELQNEVGALLEFRDVVMEAFPHLRGKLASRGKWEPGVRVRKKLREESSSQPRSRSNSRSKGSSSSGTVQDSGFCTQESKKASDQETEDELWDLLEVIHQRGTKLRLEVESLQERYGGRRSRSLEHVAEVAELRRERELLLDRVTEMEAENLARSSRLGAVSPPRRLLGASLEDLRPPPPRLGALDGLITTPTSEIKCPRGLTPDKNKTAAILRETSLAELQRHLLTTTHQVQVFTHKLEKVNKHKTDLSLQLDKVKDEVEDLKFQLEEKSIELEGTRARVRLLEKQTAKFAEEAAAHCSSTESAHHEQGERERSGKQAHRRSKIPLKAAAPRPPGPASASSTGSARSLARSVGHSVGHSTGHSTKQPPSHTSRSSSRESLGRPSPNTPHPTPRPNPRQHTDQEKRTCSLDSLETSLGGGTSRELDRSLSSTVASRLWCRPSQFFDSIDSSKRSLCSQPDSLDRTHPDLV